MNLDSRLRSMALISALAWSYTPPSRDFLERSTTAMSLTSSMTPPNTFCPMMAVSTPVTGTTSMRLGNMSLDLMSGSNGKVSAK